MEEGEILLLFQEDKCHVEISDPISQLIAAATAIGGFQTNNTHRRNILGLPILQTKLIAGMTMTGISPIFFKILITSALADAVQFGQYPVEPTMVPMYIPDIPRPARRLREGMRPLDNRRSISACFEAFKQFLI